MTFTDSHHAKLDFGTRLRGRHCGRFGSNAEGDGAVRGLRLPVQLPLLHRLLRPTPRRLHVHRLLHRAPLVLRPRDLLQLSLSLSVWPSTRSPRELADVVLPSLRNASDYVARLQVALDLPAPATSAGFIDSNSWALVVSNDHGIPCQRRCA